MLKAFQKKDSMNERVSLSYGTPLKALSALKNTNKLEGFIFIHESIIQGKDNNLSEEQNSELVKEVNALISLYYKNGRRLNRALFGFDGGAMLIFHAAPYALCLFFDDLENASEIEKTGEGFLNAWSDKINIETPNGIIIPSVNLEKAFKESEEQQDQLLSFPGSSKGGLNSATLKVFEANDGDSPSSQPTPVDLPNNSDSQGKWHIFHSQIENLLSKVLGRGQATRLIQRELAAANINESDYLLPPQFRPFGNKILQKVKDKSLRAQLEVELISILDDLVK